MIFSSLQDWPNLKGFLPPAFERALAFARRSDLLELENGTYPIDGEDIFAMLQEQALKPDEERKFELHRRYIDIQLLLEGREKQLYAPPLPPGAAMLEDRLADLDYAFCPRPQFYNAVVLRPGDFTVYFPGELHSPNCAPEQGGGSIRKIVFKISAL